VARVAEDYERDESEAERLDRNYGELLQELRVAQTGVQVLFAFLLGIAFTQRYSSLVQYQRIFYVITLIAAACTAILLIAPVAVHRLLFREHRKDEVVEFTSRLATSGLAFLALSILSSVLFVLDVVLSLGASIVATAALAVMIVVVWLLLPARHRRSVRQQDEPA
jgi:uncharacterized protein DUF6328